MEERFYFCDSCGNLMIAAIASGIIPYCCGKEMTLLTANTTDGNMDKHVPVVTFCANHCMRISIGAQHHPMTREHNIRFIYLETDIGGIIHYLQEDDSPEVLIRYDGKPTRIFAYCNIHGLWGTDLTTTPPECSSQECSAK